MMNDAIHHYNVARAQCCRGRFIERPALEGALICEMPLRIRDVAWVDIKSEIVDSGRQMINDESRPTSNIDHAAIRPHREVLGDCANPGTEESARHLKCLVEHGRFQNV